MPWRTATSRRAATCVIVHAEATRHLHRSLGRLRELGARAAVAINPATPAEAVANVLDLCAMVLVMTVNPGFGGQDYIATMEPKIAQVRRLIAEGGHDCDVEVDGGIGPATVQGAVRAGANVLVAGSALFRDPQGLDHAVAELRSLATAVSVVRGWSPSDHSVQNAKGPAAGRRDGVRSSRRA